MRAKMIPSVMAFRIAAQMDCKATIHADSQQSVGDLTPYPDQQRFAVLTTESIAALLCTELGGVAVGQSS